MGSGRHRDSVTNWAWRGIACHAGVGGAVGPVAQLAVLAAREQLAPLDVPRHASDSVCVAAAQGEHRLQHLGVDAKAVERAAAPHPAPRHGLHEHEMSVPPPRTLKLRPGAQSAPYL